MECLIEAGSLAMEAENKQISLTGVEKENVDCHVKENSTVTQLKSDTLTSSLEREIIHFPNAMRTVTQLSIGNDILPTIKTTDVENARMPYLLKEVEPDLSISGNPKEMMKLDKTGAIQRKWIPPKKDRLDPLKMDMSKPVVIPLTSSQLSLQCMECHIIFSDQKSKERHLKQSHPAEYEQCMLGDSLFACYICDSHFTNSTELMIHQKAHIERRPFKCPICGQAFNKSSELTLHKKVHFGRDGYACSDCGKPCKTLTLLKYHRRTHTGERPYVCKECDKRFSMPKALQKHMLSHSPEGDGELTHQGTGSSKAQLKINNGASIVKYPCSVCKALFKTSKTRLHHMKQKHSSSHGAASKASHPCHQIAQGGPIVMQASICQPTLLEPFGPLQQVENIDTEQICRLIESLGNVQKVNQLVILGQVPPSSQPLEPQQIQGLAEPIQLQIHQPQIMELKQKEKTKSMDIDQTITLEPIIFDEQSGNYTLSQIQMGVPTEQVEHTEFSSLQTEQTQICVENVIPEQQNAHNEPGFIHSMQVDQLMSQNNVGTLTENSEQTVVLELTSTYLPSLELQYASLVSQERSSISSPVTSSFEQTSGHDVIGQETCVSVPTLIPTIELELTLLNANQQEVPTPSFVPIEEKTQLKETTVGQLQINNDRDIDLTETVKMYPIHPELERSSVQLAPTVCEQESSERVSVEFNESETVNVEVQTTQDRMSEPSNTESNSNTQQSPLETYQSPVASQVPISMMSAQELVKIRKRKQNIMVQENMFHLIRASQVVPSRTNKKSTKRKKAKKSHLVVKFGPNERGKKTKKQSSSKPAVLNQKENPVLEKYERSVKNTSVDIEKLPLKKKARDGKRRINKSKLKPSPLFDSKVPQIPEKPNKIKSQNSLLGKEPESASKKGIVCTTIPKKTKQQRVLKKSNPIDSNELKPSGNGRKRKRSKGRRQNFEKNTVCEEDEPITPGSLLLLKGHKQPQLKVYKLDATASQGQPQEPSLCPSLTETQKVITPQHKTKIPRNKKLKMLTAVGQKKVGRPKKNPTPFDMMSRLQVLPYSTDKDLTKPKTTRKRKATSNVETEGVISSSHSRQALECKDCGERFSEVSSLQEHKEAMHVVESPGLTYTNGNIFEGVTKVVIHQPTKVSEANSGVIHAATYWDTEVEVGEIALGDKEGQVSFPALNPSPSLPLATGSYENGVCEERCVFSTTADIKPLGTIVHDYEEHCSLLHPPSPAVLPCHSKPEQMKTLLVDKHSSSSHTAAVPLDSPAHINDTKRVGLSASEDEKPQEQQSGNSLPIVLLRPSAGSDLQTTAEDDIKENLLLEVDLVTVGDQNERNQASHSQKNIEGPSELRCSNVLDPPIDAHTENEKTTQKTTNVQTTSCLTDQQDIKQEEEEVSIQKKEENMGRKRMTRGRRKDSVRIRRGATTRKSLDADDVREMAPVKDSEECHIVYHPDVLSDNSAVRDKGEGSTLLTGQSITAGQVEIGTVLEATLNMAPARSGSSSLSGSEEIPEEQVVFELESVTTSVAEMLNSEGGLGMEGVEEQNRGTGQSPGIILERFLSARQIDVRNVQHMARITNHKSRSDFSAVEQNQDIKVEDPLVVANPLQFKRRTEMQQRRQQQESHPDKSRVSDIVSDSSTRQCIFYPVKEEEGEVSLGTSQRDNGELNIEVSSDATFDLLELHPDSGGLNNPESPEVDNERARERGELLGTDDYESTEEDFEQQDVPDIQDYLCQSSDEEDLNSVELLDPQPDPEAEVMACYNNRQNILHSNEIFNCFPGSESQTKLMEPGNQEENNSGRPIDYFSRFFGWDTWVEIAQCTNKVSNLSNSITAKEVAQFVGIHIAMGTLKFPSLKLYWQNYTKVPLIADAMPRSRFSLLSRNLKLASLEEDPVNGVRREGHVHDNGLTNYAGHKDKSGKPRVRLNTNSSQATSSTITTVGMPNCSNICDMSLPDKEQRQMENSRGQNILSPTDPLWKVQPLLHHFRSGCLMLRQNDVGVDQYRLPLTVGKLNSNQPSLYSTVLVGSDGMILHIELKLDLSDKEATIANMVPRDGGMVFLCKQELSTPAIMEHLLVAGVHSAGKVGGARGQIGDEFVSSDGRLLLQRSHHGFILSTVGKTQRNMVSLNKDFEKAQRAARLNRDLRSLYHIPLSAPAPTSWPQAVLWYLTDLALINAWLLYMQSPGSECLNLLSFRLEVSRALILLSGSDTQNSIPPQPSDQTLRNSGATINPAFLQESPLPDATTRYDGSGHWPEQTGEDRGKCRYGGCERTSQVQCLKCCVFLCIARNHNCFMNFHSQGSL